MVSASCEILSELCVCVRACACVRACGCVCVCDSCGSSQECPHPTCLPPVTLDILEVRQKPILMT